MLDSKKLQIYYSGNRQIWTGIIGAASRVESLVFDQQGKILFVGDWEESKKKFSGSRIAITTIDGSLVAGYVDSHNHILISSLLQGVPSLHHCNSRQQAQIFIESLPPEEILVKNGDFRHEINREFLKKRKTPLIILHRSLHLAYANDIALNQYFPGQSKEISEPIPKILQSRLWSFEILKEKILTRQQSLLAGGVTGFSDMFFYDLDFLDALDKVADDWYLDYRLYAPRYVLEKAEEKNLLHRFIGLKTFVDGAIGARNAKFYQDYIDGGRGRFYCDQDQLSNNIIFAMENNLQPACHAIGDHAIARVTKMYQNLQAHNARIEHFEIPSLDDIERLCEIDGGASIQPNFSQDSWDYEQALGQQRAASINPLQKIIANNMNFGLGSDGMPDGYRECLLWTLMPRFKEQSLSLEQAIHHATVGSRALIGEQGGLVVGNFADFVVFDHPLEKLLKFPSEKLRKNWKELRRELDIFMPIKNVTIKGKRRWPNKKMQKNKNLQSGCQ